MSASRIVVERLSKRYSRASRVPARRWRDLLMRPRQLPSPRPPALDDVTFTVRAGEMFGVIGANGAGKSTLLRLLGGIGRPTSGRVEVVGRIGALLDLGGGFLGDLTGRENATLAGVVAGLTRAEFETRLPAIVDFAELQDFIDAPLHTYSSGMAMRLAFAVAVHTDPGVLLVDEFLSVGDLAFQAKCLQRIRLLQDGGCAIVFVSHSMDQIREMCDRALWLRHGAVAACDAADRVAAAFEEEMRAETIRRTRDVPPKALPAGGVLRMHENRFGSLEMEISDVTLRPGNQIRPGDALEVEIEFHAKERIEDPVFVVTICRDDGTICFDANTQASGAVVPALGDNGSIRLLISRLDLGRGNYFVDVGIYERTWTHAYDYHLWSYPLTVEGSSAQKGLMVAPCRWELGTTALAASIAKHAQVR